MHRILNIAGNENNDNDFITQPKADFIFITSVKADIKLLSELFNNEEFGSLNKNMRAIHISNLNTPAQIDNYINKTIYRSKFVILRLFGDKGTWSYGIDELIKWKNNNQNNKLLVLSGTEIEDISLNEISSIDINISIKLSQLLRAGGIENYSRFLKCLNHLFSNGNDIPKRYLEQKNYPDPYLYKWDKANLPNVAIISYKSLFLANEVALTDSLREKLKDNGLSPKTVFVSTLKNYQIQKDLIKLFKKEKIKIIITTTSFDSGLDVDDKNIVKFENIFSELNIPVIQILNSSKSKNEWLESSIGMNSIDLLMQIIIPEFDGRIISRPCSFKEVLAINEDLCTEITNYRIDESGIDWVINFVKNYITLQSLSNNEKKISLVISNYPVKNGRIGNGVGLNTPNSIIQILKWLQYEGYEIGDTQLPSNSKELMSKIIKSRTNDPESQSNKPLDYLSIEDYIKFWLTLNEGARQKIISRWGQPQDAIDLENSGFAINGLQFGNICLLIQPQRGYDSDSIKDIHSPDLPPPHRYLAQYHWLYKKFKSNAICHIGKHGTVEWLPGKSVGLSNACFPNVICPPIPNLYPFIVNDPGEGSQSKRRLHATIIDHLTPPLDRSELYGYLANLENLIDEYFEARLLNSNRIEIIKRSIKKLVDKEFTGKFDIDSPNLIENIDAYLCEIKESQIRIGLHTFGCKPNSLNLVNLILSISRVPSSSRFGITQFISNTLMLEIEPWTNDFNSTISNKDLEILNSYSTKKIFNFRQALDFLEEQAKYLIYYFYFRDEKIIEELEVKKNRKVLSKILVDSFHSNYFKKIKNEIVNPLLMSPSQEKLSFINSLKGEYIKSGPSGAPTRGKTEVLPTGKNFFSIDSRGLPTEAAWYMGDLSANNLLELYKQENGEDLKKIAVSIWATSTMRNGGEDICQVLSLMGVKPIWDGVSRRVVDLEVIPVKILLRPRVDVTLRISGMFRDSFPQLINLVAKAIDLVANLNEESEYNSLAEYRRNAQNIYRIFGSAPGSYGAGLQELISNSNWKDIHDLANAYLAWSSWSYDINNEGLLSKNEFNSILKDIQVVIHNQDNKEHDILDSDDYYQFQGGISAAIKSISGEYPKIYNGDFSKYSKPKVKKLKDEIDKVVISRVLNPKWIEGMKKNGYKGAFEFSATLDYLYAYDATTSLVSNWNYESIYTTWLCDKQLIEFFENNNPWALRDISERFLEIINREMWTNISDKNKEHLMNILIRAESQIENKNF